MKKEGFKGGFCVKADDIIKCHSRGILLGSSPSAFVGDPHLVLKSGGDSRLYPAYQPCGTGYSERTSYFNTPSSVLWASSPSRGKKPLALEGEGRATRGVRGFTLIELLVVVLIIGILAAVALPQYNKAVKKAQGREVYVALEALDKAMADYYLEHGTYEGISPDTLSIKIPDLKYFTYGEPGGITTGIFGIDAFSEITPTTCNITLREPNAASRFSFSRLIFRWEKGKRKIEMRAKDLVFCDYLEGSVQQVGTEGKKCFLEY